MKDGVLEEAIREVTGVLIRLIEKYDSDEVLLVVHEKLIEVLESLP